MGIDRANFARDLRSSNKIETKTKTAAHNYMHGRRVSRNLKDLLTTLELIDTMQHKTVRIWKLTIPLGGEEKRKWLRERSCAQRESEKNRAEEIIYYLSVNTREYETCRVVVRLTCQSILSVSLTLTLRYRWL